MTLDELRRDVYTHLGFAPSPATAVADRIKSHINKAHRAILREPGLERLRDTAEPLTFASEASRRIYGLPASIQSIKRISERDTDRTIWPATIEEIRAMDPGLTVTGTAERYVPIGYRPYKYRPNATGLWGESTSASDTQNLQINGIRSAGLASGDITTALTGTTRVALGTLTDYVDLVMASLEAPAVGTISIYDAAASGNEIAQIPIGGLSPQYLVIQLWPEPSSAVTFYVDGQLRIPTLDDQQDVPMLPEDFHDVLSAYARWKEHGGKEGDVTRAAIAKQEYEEGFAKLKHYVQSMPADLPVMSRNRPRLPSRLGAWTPAGSGY